MNNTLIFLRHGATQLTRDQNDVEKILPISAWTLSDDGEKQAERAAENPAFQDVNVIVISTEEKAYQTALPLIERLQKAGKKFELIRSHEIRELNRDEGGYLDKKEYDEAAEQAITNRDISVNNWETASHALERFTSEIGRVDIENDNKKIMFIGHGYTFGMYFAQQQNKLDDKRLYERIHKVPFCEWGMMKDGKILRSLLPEMEERPGERMV